MSLDLGEIRKGLVNMAKAKAAKKGSNVEDKIFEYLTPFEDEIKKHSSEIEQKIQVIIA